MPYRSELLDPERHAVEEFTCGEASLEGWLREQTVPASSRHTARTWVRVEDGVLAGYSALAVLPCGQRLGEVLVADALGRIVEAAQTVTARLAVVDALHERVASFYEALGFRRIRESLLLGRKIADIEAALTPPDLTPPLPR
jgi:ribosomal protein S18 acetylase RimI-like enzyme